MSLTIYGNTVGTPTSPKKIEEVLNPVKTVNGQAPDENGNVDLKLPEGGTGGGCLLTTETITIGEVGSVPVTGIELDYSTMQINQGDSFQIAAAVLPVNATNNIVKWRSSDDSIATVVDGYVTGIAGGNVTITAYSLENNNITATCVVTVAPENGEIKVDFNDLDIQTGLKKKDGSVVTSVAKSYYVEIPYIEGMIISTNMNASWAGGYPPFMVYDGSNYNIAERTQDGLTFTTTLTGYAENSTVFVNIYARLENDVLIDPMATAVSIPLTNCYYTYTVGGAN